jgi:antitoxin PrlF
VLPDSVRRAARLVEGDDLEVSVEEGTIVMRPKKLIDADQAWFWTEAWQRGEREASEDIAAGRVRRSEDADAFVDSQVQGGPLRQARRGDRRGLRDDVCTRWSSDIRVRQHAGRVGSRDLETHRSPRGAPSALMGPAGPHLAGCQLSKGLTIETRSASA